jgi:hypothetical protein
MAENKDEEHVDNPPNDQLEIPSEEVLIAKDDETITPTEDAENMEVHHHSFLSHGKKKWKSHFWEFLMLFLAVFCGFMAEYQLEHKIERERATKYMHNMVENLKYDTTRCNKNLAINVILGKNMDSLRFEISEAIKGNINSNRLYDLWIRTEGFSLVAFNRAAITQLKNSGNLRLVKNDSLVSEVIDYYDRKLFACEIAKDGMFEFSKRLENRSLQIFYNAPFDELLKIESVFGEPIPDSIIVKQQQILNSKPPLALLSTDPKILQQLYNEVAAKEKGLKDYNAYIRWAKDAAELLIIQIEKEYQFSKK